VSGDEQIFRGLQLRHVTPINHRKKEIIMNKRFLVTTITAALFGASGAVFAGAGLVCPPNTLGTTNLVKGGSIAGGSFENCGPKKTWTEANPGNGLSANTNWLIHSNNSPSKPVTTECIPSTAPGPNFQKMLHVEAGAHESGVFQDLRPTVPLKVMFSAWVFVNKGRVWIQAHGGGTDIPAAATTKIGQWEQLRVCTDGTLAPDIFYIVNQDAAGGDFYVDKVEIRQIIN
jgi:hypothetical protein